MHMNNIAQFGQVKIIWLVVLEFNATLTAKVIDIMAVGDAYVFPGFLTPVLTKLFFPKLPTTFLTCFAEVRGENTPERKVASTRDQTHNHQVWVRHAHHWATRAGQVKINPYIVIMSFFLDLWFRSILVRKWFANLLTIIKILIGIYRDRQVFPVFIPGREIAGIPHFHKISQKLCHHAGKIPHFKSCCCIIQNRLNFHTLGSLGLQI